MIVGLDTSVVVRLLTREPEDLALTALRYLRKRRLAGDRVLVCDWAVAEAYYALQHHYAASKKDTLRALRGFLESPGIETTGEVAEVIATPGLESAKPGFVDRLIYAHYRGAGADGMVTFEKAAAQLAGVEVLSA